MIGIMIRFKKLTKKQVLLGAIIACVVIAAAAAVMASATDVNIDTVKKGSLQGLIELRGKVELENREKVFSRIAGTIKEIKVKEGEAVTADGVLAQMDVQDMSLAATKAQEVYNSAKAALEDYKTSIKPEEIKAAQAQVQQASIAVELAQKDYGYKKDKAEKMRQLQQNGGISEQELKDAELVLSAAESALRDGRQKLDIAVNNLNKLKNGVSEYGVDAARANAEQARLQVEETMNNLDRTLILSGIKGTVLAKHVEKGEYIQPGTLLFEVGDAKTAYIKADILADDAVKVKPGQKVIISGEAVDDMEYQGEVYYIAPRAEAKVSTLGVEQQRVEIRISYDNSAVDLKQGYGVDLKVITEEKKDAIFVPDKAVFDMGGKDAVFVVKNDKLNLVKVETGIENDDYIEITKGLSEGDKVVVDPDNKLKAGMKVK